MKRAYAKQQNIHYLEIETQVVREIENQFHNLIAKNYNVHKF